LVGFGVLDLPAVGVAANEELVAQDERPGVLILEPVDQADVVDAGLIGRREPSAWDLESVELDLERIHVGVAALELLVLSRDLFGRRRVPSAHHQHLGDDLGERGLVRRLIVFSRQQASAWRAALPLLDHLLLRERETELRVGPISRSGRW
jgi:hypothetical protein